MFSTGVLGLWSPGCMILRHLLINLLFGTLMLVCADANASQDESYEMRPSIFEIAPVQSQFDEYWESIKKAQLIFVAQLLELYPNKQLYFLARDAEYLYDVAQLATKGTADFSRIHLINVSRANMRDRNFVPYLNQKGISEESLKAGNEILLIDSGYNGSIPDHIKFQFSEEASRNIKAQFILSKDRSIPSSRSFLLFLNKNAHRLNPQTSDELKNDLLSYEHLEKQTRRSTYFKKKNGIYHPMSPLKDTRAKSSSWSDKLIASFQASENRTVDPALSLRRRADLKANWDLAETQKLFIQTKEVMKNVRQALVVGQAVDFNNRSHLFDSFLLDAYDILKGQGYKLAVNKSELTRLHTSSQSLACRRIFKNL